MHLLEIDNIIVEINRKNIKNLHMRVYPPQGNVKLSAPKKMPEYAIKSFILSKLEWIKTQQGKIAEQNWPKPLQFINGEKHHYQGNSYFLNIIENRCNPKVEFQGQTINMYVGPNSTLEKRQQILNDWYRRQLKIRIPELIAYYETIMNVEVSDFGIKKMKTKWGTCNITAKRIWINLELAKKSPECLTYIVVHEMTHLIEPSHNKIFYKLIDKFMPDWKLAEKELNTR